MNTSNKMFKYYVGLGVLGIFTIVILGITITKGVTAKQDNMTKKRSREIAKDLNTYVTKNKKIPESFDEAGIKDVPNTITYKKDSDTEYTFCATYKEAYSYGSSDPTSLLSGASLRRSSSYEDDSRYESSASSYKSSYLYPNYTYKKGENCQTIKPYSNTSIYTQPSSRSTTPSASTSARDTVRRTDINAMHAKLEEYYNNNNGYPSTFTAATFPGLDSAALIDATGKSIAIAKATANESAALAVASPTTLANYLYVPFGCTSTLCKGYILKTFIESPTGTFPNPYTKKGLNN